MDKEKGVDQKKRGNRFGFWFFRLSVRISGLRGAYGFLYIVCLYYLLFDRTSFSASMAYIKRRFKNYNLFQRIYGVYRLMISQGKNLIDRYYLISGQGKFDMEFQGYDKIKHFLSNPQKGFILLTAHVGNWQVTMTALAKLERTVYLLMLPEENTAVKESLNIDGETGTVRIISAADSLGSVVEAMKVIDEGNIVSIMGDRTYGNNSIEVDFLGGKVSLPYGAFTIAAAAQCPVVVLLSAKVSEKKYITDASHVIEPRFTSRGKKREDIRGFVQEFAVILEDYVATYPFQWFVFRDIWNENSKTMTK